MAPDTGAGLYDETAARASGVVLAGYSTSFGLGTKLLGARTRRGIEAVYALVRIADEIVDTRRGADAGPLLSAADRQEAKDLADAAKPLVSSLRVTVTEPGAEILVDDDKVGISPLAAPVLLDLGKRRIRVQKAGFKPFDRTEQVAGGTALTIIAALERDLHQGRVAVTAGPRDLIAVDGKARGQGKWEGKLPSGGHTLRVTSPGMTTYQAEVLVQDDRSREILVTLSPLAKASSTSTWLWIAGGAVIVAGAVVGGAFLFQPTRRPEVDGTLGTFPLSYGGR